MKIDLREEVLNKYDDYLKNTLQEHWNNGPKQGFGQYNILAHLSTYFNNDVIVDIGTGHQAVSARSLSYNETNIVYSYDTEFSEIAKGHIDSLDNVIYDVFNPLKSPGDRDILLSASLISLDVDPHDGEQEKDFYDFFIENNWGGVMVCDDIRLGRDTTNNHTTMAAFWESVNKSKYDLTDTIYAHNTGTGIICFDDQEVIFNLDEDKIIDDPNKWVFSKNDIIIQRFDDGTFKNNYGVTGTWNMVVDAAGEEKILIKTKSGSIEVPNF